MTSGSTETPRGCARATIAMSALNLEKSELDTLHARIGDVLKDADLSLISAKKTRAALAALPPGSLPASLDLVEQKKSIDVEIRKCFDAVTNGGKAAKPKKAARTPKPKAEPKPKKAPAEAKPKKTTRKHAAADTDDEPKRKRASSANSPLHRPMALSPAMAEVCGGDQVGATTHADASVRSRETALGLHQGEQFTERDQQAPGTRVD